MTLRRRLSTSDREKLYDNEAAKAHELGLGELPICNICQHPIDGVKSAWDESHDPKIPNWLGGEVTGIAHRRCNRKHNNEHDTPLRNQRAANTICSVETTVEYESDINYPGRTKISISGPSRDAVQAEITRAMLAAENMTGNATFRNPWLRKDGAWASVGEVIIDQTGGVA